MTGANDTGAIELTRPTRRRLLRTGTAFLTAGALTGATGCLGGSSDTSGATGATGGGGGTSGSGGGATTSTLECSRITDGYEPFDVGATVLLFDLELPAVLVGAAEVAEVAQEVTANQGNLVIDVGHVLEGTTNPTMTAPEDAREKAERRGTLTFDGEERPVFATQPDGVYGPQRFVELPATVDGDRYYFRTQLTAKKLTAEDTSDACLAALDDAAQHVVMSLAPNPETTIERVAKV